MTGSIQKSLSEGNGIGHGEILTQWPYLLGRVGHEATCQKGRRKGRDLLCWRRVAVGVPLKDCSETLKR